MREIIIEVRCAQCKRLITSNETDMGTFRLGAPVCFLCIINDPTLPHSFVQKSCTEGCVTGATRICLAGQGVCGLCDQDKDIERHIA